MYTATENFIVAFNSDPFKNKSAVMTHSRHGSCGDIVRSLYSSSYTLYAFFSGGIKRKSLEQWLDFLTPSTLNLEYLGIQSDVKVPVHRGTFTENISDYHVLSINAGFVNNIHAMIAYTATRYIYWNGITDLIPVTYALKQAYPTWSNLKCLAYSHYVFPLGYVSERGLVPLDRPFKVGTEAELRTACKAASNQHEAFCKFVILPPNLKITDLEILARSGKFNVLDSILENEAVPKKVEFRGKPYTVFYNDGKGQALLIQNSSMNSSQAEITEQPISKLVHA